MLMPRLMQAALAVALQIASVLPAAADPQAEPPLAGPLPDEPGLVLPAPPLAAEAEARPAPRRLTVALSLQSGYLGFASMFGEAAASPFLGGEVRFLWTMRNPRIELGLRLGAASSLGMSEPGGCGYANGPYGGCVPISRGMTVVSGDVAFVASFYGFWISPGVGVLGWVGAGTLPDLSLGIGYDLPLGRHFALRVSGQAGTSVVLNRATLGAGLVVRL